MTLERRHQKLLPRRLFIRRMARWSAAAGIILLGSLAIGVWGYHYFERLPWIDSLLNASMTAGGKLFASFYALYSGLAIISAAGVLFTPVFHRFLHSFHIEADKSG